MILDDEGKVIYGKQSVSLNPYVAREPKPFTLINDQELIAGVGGNAIVDTECYLNYYLIAFKFLASGKIEKFVIDNDTGEVFNERKLAWIMTNYCTIGFNSIKYDLVTIWCAYKYQDAELIKEISDQIIFQNMYPSGLEKEYDFTIHKTKHIDLIEVCPLVGSLKLYGARLHALRIQDLPFNVNEPLSEERKAIVDDYCLNDLDTTQILFDNLADQLKLRADLSIEYRQDLMSKSDAQIAETVIGSELRKITGKWPKKSKLDSGVSYNYQVPSFVFFQTPYMNQILDKVRDAKYSVLENGRVVVPPEIKSIPVTIADGIYRMGNGGLHSSEKCVSYKSNDEYQIYDRDVASYYPRIVLNCQLYPQHLGTDFFTVYNAIVERRLTAKKAKNNAIAECLKITINGTFGKLGSPYSILYAPDLMIQVTVTGQLALLMLIERLELSSIKIISANTDGILIYCHKSQVDEMLSIVKMWEQVTGFETEESKYAAYYARDVNAYMAVKTDDKFKGKNVYYDPWRGDLKGRDGYWRFQKNPNAQICIEAIENLIVKGIPVKETIENCKDITKFLSVKNVTGGAHKDGYYLGKTVRWYHAEGIVGTINYIKNNHTVPETDGALPLMDLPSYFPNNINYSWYVAKCEEMLENMGFLSKKQLSFF